MAPQSDTKIRCVFIESPYASDTAAGVEANPPLSAPLRGVASVAGIDITLARDPPIDVTPEGCGQLLMFWKGGNAILVDFLPELVPPAFGEDEGSQAEDNLSALWRPAHSRATQPLFDQSFACGLCDA